MAFKKNTDFNIAEDDEQKMSRINSAGIINVTIENLWRESYSSMSKGDLVTWNRKLDAIWCILGGDVEENSEEDKKFKEIDLKIHQNGSLSHVRTGFDLPKEDTKEKSSIQYLLLRKKSLFLRRLQNSQGKGTAYQDEDSFDID
jgi:hypothetical protein